MVVMFGKITGKRRFGLLGLLGQGQQPVASGSQGISIPRDGLRRSDGYFNLPDRQDNPLWWSNDLFLVHDGLEMNVRHVFTSLAIVPFSLVENTLSSMPCASAWRNFSRSCPRFRGQQKMI
jgi:hypothetical protein